MSTPDTTGSNDSVRDASLSQRDASLFHLPNHIRRAIEITPAAGTTYLCSGPACLCSGAGCPHGPRLSPTRLNVRPRWRRSWRISISRTTPFTPTPFTSRRVRVAPH
ncbi:hypothetical protein ACGFY7_25905 [Streptomyces prunicolor]|uniref:hypothetical protein n=1 Tax=Streptomyces prunicolor TaxID=67348 RepID=UPI003719542A